MAKKIPIGQYIEFSHLTILRELFNWEEDFTQADMLAAIIIELRKKLPSEWKTPLQMLIEVLVQSGRSSLALEIVKFEIGFNIPFKGHKLTVKEYISVQNIPERKIAISSDFSIIAQKMLNCL